jgi:hypothetical protein
MKYYKIPALVLVLISSSQISLSQEQRLADNNTIGWFVYTGTFKIKPRLSVHTEYQWRRADGVKNWQQGLLRTSINYAVKKEVSINAGYAFVETFPYGTYTPVHTYPEHRIFEQAVINNPIGRLSLSHRFTLEQRFVGAVTVQNGKRNTDWNYLNRIRYRIRAEFPLSKNTKSEKNIWSIAFMDELFIGWGKQIGANIFDQNRLSLLLNYKVNKTIKLEAGYLNQIVQQGKRINDKTVFQYNNGFILATHLSLSLLK